MTQEDKELLLKDLCARVPYGMFVHHKNVNQDYNLIAVFDDGRIGVTTLKENVGLTPTSINECKPYLRPMSSMTEEERKEWFKYSHVEYDCEFKPEPTLLVDYCHLSIDWLNAHHFDYRGLIPMGLALEAPADMYKI